MAVRCNLKGWPWSIVKLTNQPPKYLIIAPRQVRWLAWSDRPGDRRDERVCVLGGRNYEIIFVAVEYRLKVWDSWWGEGGGGGGGGWPTCGWIISLVLLAPKLWRWKYRGTEHYMGAASHRNMWPSSHQLTRYQIFSHRINISQDKNRYFRTCRDIVGKLDWGIPRLS